MTDGYLSRRPRHLPPDLGCVSCTDASFASELVSDRQILVKRKAVFERVHQYAAMSLNDRFKKLDNVELFSIFVIVASIAIVVYIVGKLITPGE